MLRPSAAVTVATSILVVLALVAGGLPPAAADELATVRHRAPVEAPVVDRFDLPPRPWMPGNRGIDYGTGEGTVVRASADGEVVFAGAVAGARHVTVLHADGLRTSYSFLAEVAVTAGQRVVAGQAVGTTGGPLHFGVRAPDDTYLDPEALLAGTLEPGVRLVPGAEEGLEPLRERRSLLEVLVGGGVAAATFIADRGVAATELAVHLARELDPGTHLARGAVAVWDQLRLALDCTPASSSPPPPSGRRIVVLVGGLGTTSDASSAWEVDTEALGYASDDVVRFSYRGGRSPTGPSPPARHTAPGAGAIATGLRHDLALGDIPARAYGAVDSQQSLATSADHLAELLADVQRAEPGVPIDVVAHSQGGVVARLGVVRAAARGELPVTLENLVTLGSPHQGAPLATGVVGMQGSGTGRDALALLRQADPGPISELDDRLPAIGELSGVSVTLAAMRDTPIPEGVRFSTIGASGDLTVPGGASADPSADRNVRILTGISTDTHGDLASMPEVTREIALAVRGAPPSCQSPWEGWSSFVVGDSVRTGETVLAAGAAGSTALADGLRAVGGGATGS